MLLDLIGIFLFSQRGNKWGCLVVVLDSMTPKLYFHNQDVLPTSLQNVGFSVVGVRGGWMALYPIKLDRGQNKTRQDGAP